MDFLVASKRVTLPDTQRLDSLEARKSATSASPDAKLWNTGVLLIPVLNMFYAFFVNFNVTCHRKEPLYDSLYSRWLLILASIGFGHISLQFCIACFPKSISTLAGSIFIEIILSNTKC